MREALVQEIQKESPKGDDPPAPAKQKLLLDLSNQISALLGELVNGKRDVSKEQKYLLEGQVGTYATVPKPFGDQLTPDHQPQAAAIVAVAAFFQKFKPEGAELQKRAANRANQGYAINLHFDRHVAGRTYGSKGKKTSEEFKQDMETKAGNLPLEKARVEISTLLKKEMKEDVAQMKICGENRGWPTSPGRG